MSLTKHLFVLLLCSLAFTANAQPRESTEGVHYQPLPTPVPTTTDEDHIEVRDIFWYGCPQCSTLEPLMTEWRDGVTGDLVFVRMPAVWNDLMALHAKIFFTGRTLGNEDGIHQAAFKAVQEQGNPLRTPEQIKEFFLANGATAEAFDTAWNSEEVNAAVQEAKLRTGDYGIDKLPAVILNGRYKVVHNAKVFDHVEFNLAFNNVIFKLRDERRSDF
ncbi:MAG: thiol:disulfide interchange protein DsbA/DsbL [Pseudomonadota bacterium]